MPLKEKPWKALLKRKISTSNIGKVNNAILDLREYGLCHHCKNLFPNSQMLSCKYKSSTMGLPQLNPAFLDPFSHNSNRKTCQFFALFLIAQSQDTVIRHPSAPSMEAKEMCFLSTRGEVNTFCRSIGINKTQRVVSFAV